jgi:NhaA family Na+:H+ antiporter
MFAQNKVAGAILLMVATAAALIWANSPWAGTYHEILGTHAHVGVGALDIDKPLLLWINDGLMGLFFFVVGLEIKREILAGELSTARKAALPVAAAIGGMVGPALLYVALNVSGPGASGWGIPMATDIAFALGVLLLVGPRVPIGLKVFLTALAIVDDIGAIVVIAIFYTDTIAVASLLAGAGMIAVSIVANVAGVRSSVFYYVLGAAVWVAFLKSGIHATLAAVLMAMTIPARTRIDGAPLVARLDKLLDKLRRSGLPEGKGLLDNRQHHIIHQMQTTTEHATAPLQDLEHAFMPVVTFLVMPIFALANAGVDLGGGLLDAFREPVCLGIIVGLFVGKQIGIFSASWIAVRVGIADLPRGVGWRHIHAVGILGGIGFTMSLFVASLAFDDPTIHQTAKAGILSASILSAIVGAWLLSRAARSGPDGDEDDAGAVTDDSDDSDDSSAH